MADRMYSLQEVREIIRISKTGHFLRRKYSFTLEDHERIVQNIRNMDKYPEVFGKGKEESPYATTVMLEQIVSEQTLESSLPF